MSKTGVECIPHRWQRPSQLPGKTTKPEDQTINVYRLSKFLSVVAMTSAVIAISVTHFKFPPVGYEGMVFMSSVAVVLAIGAALLSLVLVGSLLIRRKLPHPVNPAVVSLLSLALAFTYVWTM